MLESSSLSHFYFIIFFSVLARFHLLGRLSLLFGLAQHLDALVVYVLIHASNSLSCFPLPTLVTYPKMFISSFPVYLVLKAVLESAPSILFFLEHQGTGKYSVLTWFQL